MIAPVQTQDVRVGRLGMPGELVLTPSPLGLVLCAPGSRPRRARQRRLAEALQDQHLATLWVDLWHDARSARRRLDLPPAALSERIRQILDWLLTQPAVERLHVGLFACDEGADAVLRAAAENPAGIDAVVVLGAPDGGSIPGLQQVQVPTLLIVGGDDAVALKRNRVVLRHLRCNKRLEIVPGSARQFDSPAVLNTVAHLAGDWFGLHLGSSRMC